jgi:hypothetical protein
MEITPARSRIAARAQGLANDGGDYRRLCGVTGL